MRESSDESYVINLCERVLAEKAERQHRFSWLTGDTGRPLPGDAYFPESRVVVEYRERQHLAHRGDDFAFWDGKMTASGISRREQRAKFDRLPMRKYPVGG